MATNYGTFTKGGETRKAQDAGEAVALRFDGWAEADESPKAGDKRDSATK